ncbi:SRPBCC family protein [Streptomyces sp. BR123]|uniref:SRPBCC domain-containing protein n=1 Tax=Streptomyces sp. BR123 TaxID=2749828 RepID=UPI0015C4E500|nr:SRPBCC domain-containing protein [Streptomyces sp. BR123]NXY96732.1 SRPBCC family protein [Streptomyces sp. BR123]
MEHQVFVPVPADRLRAVLRDPARVARCVPGLQQEAAPDAAQDAQAAGLPLPGRMKFKVGPNTVTYRGTLTVTEQDPDHFAVSGEGTEIRGSGTVTLSVGLRLAAADGGTSLEFTAGGEAGGRAAGLAPEAVRTAVQRLLDRAAAQLAALAGGVGGAEGADGADGADGAGTAGAAGEPGGAGTPAFGADGPYPAPDPDLDPLPGEALDGPGDLDGLGELGGLGDLEDIGSASDFGELDRLRGLDAFAGPPQPPAEAAHARRTMIGRSAEEVDHAPPRGRYAPAPASASATTGAGLRWLAPAAALALASAVVLGRALRRRR